MAMQFTNRANDALSDASRSAAANGNAQLEPVHLLDSLLSQGIDSIAVALISAAGAD